MKQFRLIATAAACLLFGWSSCFAQGIDDKIALYFDKWDGQFALGDTVNVFAQVKEAGTYHIRLFDKGIEKDSWNLDLPAGKSVIYQDVYDQPSAMMLHVSTPENTGNFTKIGFVAGAEGFKPGFKAPKDLKKFWKEQVKEMRSVPMRPKVTPVELTGADAELYECYEIELQMNDPTPVRGFIAKPKNAKRRSLPIVIYAHAAGVSGGWCRSTAQNALYYAKMGNGAIALDINAHGMLNNQPDKYYLNLEQGELKDYSRRTVTDHKSFYFRRMFLRMERAIDYAVKDAAWDHKRLLITGQSQGGAQSAALAGIDKRVSAIVTILPAMHDIGGKMAERRPAWPFDDGQVGLDSPAAKIAPYYDCAVLLGQTKATICCEAGLSDMTCPPAGVFAALNAAKGKKIIVTCPYRAHEDVLPYYSKDWQEKCEAVRKNFFKEYLK